MAAPGTMTPPHQQRLPTNSSGIQPLSSGTFRHRQQYGSSPFMVPMARICAASPRRSGRLNAGTSGSWCIASRTSSTVVLTAVAPRSSHEAIPCSGRRASCIRRTPRTGRACTGRWLVLCQSRSRRRRVGLAAAGARSPGMPADQRPCRASRSSCRTSRTARHSSPWPVGSHPCSCLASRLFPHASGLPLESSCPCAATRCRSSMASRGRWTLFLPPRRSAMRTWALTMRSAPRRCASLCR